MNQPVSLNSAHELRELPVRASGADTLGTQEGEAADSAAGRRGFILLGAVRGSDAGRAESYRGREVQPAIQ